jgi:hypothetical protein
VPEHIPLAKKLGAEVDAFFKLWRTRRWLAVLLLLGLSGFGIWSVGSNWTKAKQIERLEGEKNRLETTLRESERENRGLRETVAPLLARAAKEFPGEEINNSLKKLVERLEADRPGNKPLASASASVEIVIDSPEQQNAHAMDESCFIAFGRGIEAVLTARSVDSFRRSIGTNEYLYHAVAQMPADDKMIGKPLRNIADAEYLQIEFSRMGETEKVIRGKAVVVFNGSLRAEFSVPAQTTSGRRILVRNIQGELRSTMQ